MWAGVEHLLLAQDRDTVGDAQAHQCGKPAWDAGFAGPITRLTPSVTAKDWSEVAVASDVARMAIRGRWSPIGALVANAPARPLSPGFYFADKWRREYPRQTCRARLPRGTDCRE